MNRTRVVLWSTIALVGLSAYFLLPTLRWYRMAPDERTELEQERDPILKQILNLGLDLRGGMHLVLELDRSKLPPEIQGFAKAMLDARDRAIEIIRNRVDQIGLAEPLIIPEGDRWIVAQMPGVKDSARAKELIGKTALLEFRLVDDSNMLSSLSKVLLDKKLSMDQYMAMKSSGTLTADLMKAVPEGWEVLPMQERNNGERLGHTFLVVKSTPEMTGSNLVDARVSFGGGSNSMMAGYPSVSFEFNAEGAKQFGLITEANINKPLAIVLDGQIQSAPNIKSAIPDGHGEISGSFDADEAKFLATVLKAGALPAPVRVIEERTVGATLGEDSIKAGVRSCLIGLALVMLMMGIYYNLSGVIADVAMLINMLCIFGSLAWFHATLTLPGIAGMILSLAMAVDANVLILERVREEMQLGKSIRLSVDLGYKHAWPAIIDGHVTNFISALLLFQFGTGPVKGFAVTLMSGIVISIFTAVFFTHMVYDYWLEGREVSSLHF